MGFVNSAIGQITGVIPDANEPPVVHTHLLNIVNQLEKRSNMRFSNTTARDAAITSPENGMICGIGSPVSEIYSYLNGAWVKIYPLIRSGTTVPSNALGANGDLYVQYS